MNLILILIPGEIIYTDYSKSTESMKAGLCPSNKGCGSSEVMAEINVFTGPSVLWCWIVQPSCFIIHAKTIMGLI